MQIPEEVYFPYTGLALWVPRLQFVVVLGIFLTLNAREGFDFVPWIVLVCVGALVVESILYYQRSWRRTAFLNGELIQAKIIRKRYGSRISIPLLTVEYQIGGNEYRSEGAVPYKAYLGCLEGASLTIKVHPKMRGRWVPYYQTCYVPSSVATQI